MKHVAPPHMENEVNSLDLFGVTDGAATNRFPSTPDVEPQPHPVARGSLPRGLYWAAAFSVSLVLWWGIVAGVSGLL